MTTTTDNAVITVSGTPLELLPLSTPYPSMPGCDKYLYRHDDDAYFLAWDPVYGQVKDPKGQSCFPPEVTSWWLPGNAPRPTKIALGPTFVCPEAYTPVQTVLVASDVQELFCCPSQYDLHVPQPLEGSFPSQCVSTARSGEIITFLTLNVQSTVFTVTTVESPEVTVFGVPVNGFNVLQRAAETLQDDSSDSTVPATGGGAGASETGTAPATPENKDAGPSLATIVGVSIGAAVAIIFVAMGAFLFWRRRKRIAKGDDVLPVAQFYDPANASDHRQELASHSPPQELKPENFPRVYELYGQRT